MSTAVIHFEDIEKVTRIFRTQLENAGLNFDENGVHRWKFVSYCTTDPKKTPSTRPPADVAKEAGDWIGEVGNIERLVLLTDLRPEAATPPKHKMYGLDVLAKLAEYLGEDQDHPPFIFNVQDLASSRGILVCFLTGFGLDLKSGLNTHSAWKETKVRTISPYHTDRKRLTISEALQEIDKEGARVVYADRAVCQDWAANLVAQWIIKLED
ncbi:hypothetical protein ACFL6U_32435 [Planctomycetota bacterium]